MDKPKYSYKYRPAYGKDLFLIELWGLYDAKEAVQDILIALEEIKPEIGKTHDLWQNDEVIIQVNSMWGDFEISVDNWGGIFIMNEYDQSCIETIHDILYCNPNFESLKVDYDEYKERNED